MSRQNYLVKETYLGNGSLNAYTFSFKIEDLRSLLVIEVDTVTGTETQRVRGDDTTYLSGVDFDPVDGAGTITLTNNLAVNRSLIIVLQNVLPSQTFRFRNKGDFTLERFESALDLLAGAIQTNSYLAQRAFRVHDLDDETTFSALLPPGGASSAGRVLAIKSDGSGIEYGPSIADINAVAPAATAAAASAAQAAASAVDSANSATAAAISETNAGNLATAASSSAGNAFVNAQQAAASAVAAAASALDADASETSAAASENACNSNRILTEIAVTAAQTSETNASNSATAASSSASSASSSASSASSSAGNAFTSASNAQNSANDAAAIAAVVSTIGVTPTSFVSPDRDLATNHVNNTGGAIYLMVTVVGTSSAASRAELFLNGASVQISSSAGQAFNYSNVTALIPDGVTYRVNGVGTLTRWSEIR